MDRITLVDEARKYLKNKAIDSAHGLDHHKAVAENCLKIIKAEHLQLNTQAVIIAAWWHDIEDRQGSTDLLKKEMVSEGIDSKTIKEITSIVHNHTFGRTPETLEEKVLFDADKIEYFNPQRMEKILEDVKNGSLSIDRLKEYYITWLNRYKIVLTSFNFLYSKNVALNRVAATKKEIEKIRIFLQLNFKE